MTERCWTMALHVNDWHCSMLPVVRYYPTLPRIMHTLLHVSISNVNADSIACTHISRLMVNGSPAFVPAFWNIIYLLRGYMLVYNVIVDTLPWTETQIATFRAMNMDPFNNNNNNALSLFVFHRLKRRCLEYSLNIF